MPLLSRQRNLRSYDIVKITGKKKSWKNDFVRIKSTNRINGWGMGKRIIKDYERNWKNVTKR